MTPNPSPLFRTVDDMLLDAGETGHRLRATLLTLGSFAAVPVPEPRAELAALLSGGSTPLERHRLRHRLRRHHRPAAVGLAVIAGMGLGVTGVAAIGPAAHLSASPSIQHLLQDWSPSWSITGKPAAQGGAGHGAGDPAVGTSLGEAAAAGQDTPDAGRGDTARGGAGSAAPEDAAPGTGAGAGQGTAERGAAGGQAADGGASGNAANATPGGAAAQDAPAKAKQATGGSGGAGGLEEADPRRELASTGRIVADAPAVVENVASGLLAPAADEKTGAGKAGPGSIWLKKFSR